MPYVSRFTARTDNVVVALMNKIFTVPLFRLHLSCFSPHQEIILALLCKSVVMVEVPGRAEIYGLFIVYFHVGLLKLSVNLFVRLIRLMLLL